MKKRYLGIACAAISVLLAALILLWYAHTDQTVRLDRNITGCVIYRYGSVSFEEPLTQEQLDVAVQIINGKKLVPESVTGIPNCPFSRDVEIILGGRPFLMACDDCPLIQDGETGRYFVIDETDRQALKEIFASHGGVFPCIR